MTEESIEKIGKALSDKTRVKLLEEIKCHEGLCCMEAQNCTSLTQPTVSHHIKILIDSGLVKAERAGRKVKLKINKKELDKFTNYMNKLVV
ncbi:MAG TPA: metalloregulator ArsR/SmtB family transcription factor [Candidatus Paceibacterota bacterium]